MDSQIPINQRIKELIDDLAGGTQKRFADDIGVAPSMISDLFGKRQSRPGFDTLTKIGIAYPQVRMDWLINSRGPKYRSPEELKKLQDYIEPPIDPNDPHPEATLAQTQKYKPQLLMFKVTEDATDAHMHYVRRYTFAHWIIGVRRIRGILTESAAAACELTEIEFLRIEAAEADITEEALLKLAHLYRVPVEYLTTGQDTNFTLLRALNDYERQSPTRLRADLDEIMERLKKAGV